MIELAPCPFCGSTKLKIDSKKSSNFRYVDGHREDNHVVTVRCNRCHTRGPTTSVWVRSWRENPIDQLTEVASELWNKRFDKGDP